MTDVVIFDLDGTLIDTPRAIVAAFTAAFAAMKQQAPGAQAIRTTIGLPLERAFSDLLGVPPEDELVQVGIRHYQAQFANVILPQAADLVYPGVADGLRALREQGFILAVATSKYYSSADALLTAAGLRGYFSVVAGADQVTRPKPDPETCQLIMRELCIETPGRALMVGDTTHDLRMAAAAGLRSIAVTYGVHSAEQLLAADPTWRADTFSDVLRCLSDDLPGFAQTKDGDLSALARNRSAVVTELLNDRTYHIEFNGHLTNHAKHAVIALARLGAPAERIMAFYENYAALTPYGYPLEPPRQSRYDIGAGNWSAYLGRRTSFGAYCDFFERQEKELGPDGLLLRYAPTLLPGWVGAFTHATIHLGWALDAGNRWMTIEGLAYSAFSYVSCHQERALPGGTDGQRSAASLLRVAAAWESDEAGLRSLVEALVNDMDSGLAAGIHPELARSGLQYRQARLLGEGHPLIYQTPAWIGELSIESVWEQLYYAVTLLYVAVPGDFVLLHLITALHGMEQVARRLPADQQRQAATCFWIGAVCVLLAERNVPAAADLAALDARYERAFDPSQRPGCETGWDDTIARAIAEDEEHNPKMVYVLRRLWRRTRGQSIYREAASHFTATPELPESFEQPPTE